jgi:hypothetical protein
VPPIFPGMDPYIEGQEWEDFHNRLQSAFADALAPHLRPRYVARIEKRVYVERPPDEGASTSIPDLAVIRTPSSGGEGAVTGSIPPAPFAIPLPVAEERREPYLEIRLRDGGQLVTVLEILSPSNKRPGSEGWTEYQNKRQRLLQSAVHLIEIDLLRGGQRMPAARPLPPADYYLLVSRGDRRPLAEVWPLTVRDPLPVIPVPLLPPEPDAPLDLQAAFGAVYERAGYDYSLDYRHGTVPPLAGADAAWAEELIAAALRAA